MSSAAGVPSEGGEGGGQLQTRHVVIVGDLGGRLRGGWGGGFGGGAGVVLGDGDKGGTVRGCAGGWPGKEVGMNGGGGKSGGDLGGPGEDMPLWGSVEGGRAVEGGGSGSGVEKENKEGRGGDWIVPEP